MGQVVPIYFWAEFHIRHSEIINGRNHLLAAQVHRLITLNQITEKRLIFNEKNKAWGPFCNSISAESCLRAAHVGRRIFNCGRQLMMTREDLKSFTLLTGSQRKMAMATGKFC
jgi:hypothetical protein